jgi:pimeloyl-ACP methyl ester carboxylesterase
VFETQEITDQIRASQPGNSVKLAAGSVYYQLEGPEHGELIVLIHGMSIPLLVWDPMFAVLTKEGFRVLRYDLFGRGYSDRPHVRYDVDLYVSQLIELLEALELTGQKINLVGFSLGAAICATFAIHYPHLVKRICFIDPVHPADMSSVPSKIWKTIVKFRYLAISIDQNVIDGLPNNFYRYEDFPDFEEQFTAQLDYKGFAQALMSTMIDFNFTLLNETYFQMRQLDIPICLMWGEEDRLALFETSEIFRKLIPTIQFHPIAEAGHLSHYERPDLVNPLLLQFLSS